jgi:hypothetical protein
MHERLHTELVVSTRPASTNQRESDTLGRAGETIATIEKEQPQIVPRNRLSIRCCVSINLTADRSAATDASSRCFGD